ncbi:hypothetical protein BD311DRAFT_756149 [Dichomitus squalens]|uniref:Uncharacterized protein n=1 Tax=Dichomitus squalens TaxID=114155 RepID=A0A4Q9MQB0_9APHY|nr:hypothetical protein BD311DRAFT_756149 [Dichomitus squalens]
MPVEQICTMYQRRASKKSIVGSLNDRTRCVRCEDLHYARLDASYLCPFKIKLTVLLVGMGVLIRPGQYVYILAQLDLDRF